MEPTHGEFCWGGVPRGLSGKPLSLFFHPRAILLMGCTWSHGILPLSTKVNHVKPEAPPPPYCACLSRYKARPYISSLDTFLPFLQPKFAHLSPATWAVAFLFCARFSFSPLHLPSWTLSPRETANLVCHVCKLVLWFPPLSVCLLTRHSSMWGGRWDASIYLCSLYRLSTGTSRASSAPSPGLFSQFLFCFNFVRHLNSDHDFPVSVSPPNADLACPSTSLQLYLWMPSKNQATVFCFPPRHLL